jgi:hypothetical protein
VDSYFPGELVLSDSGFIEFLLAKDAHLGAWGATVDNLRSKAVHEEPGTIALVLLCLQTPTPFISDGIFVETFGSSATCFTDSDSSFSKAAEEFNEVDDSQAQPFLELGSS